MIKNGKVKECHGSRIHILRWVERPDFANQLSHLLCLTGATVLSTDVWMPKGFSNPAEPRLEQFDPLPACVRQALQNWWLVHKCRANTPNWDLASTCTIQGQQGLVLIEGKAHVKELNENDSCRATNKANLDRIGQAICEASQALAKEIPGVNISRDTHYQLANRVAFSWKIASLGIPVILVYLGFLGDKSWPRDQFEDDRHWMHELRKYMDNHIPEDFISRWIDCGEEQIQMIIRSLPVE